MKVLLISANTERINMVTMPLGLGLVTAAARQAGHDATMLDLMNQDDPLAAVRDAVSTLRPEVIGISVRNIDDQTLQAPRFLLEQAKAVVSECRAWSEAPIVLGGAGYSIFPCEVLRYLEADYGVYGDGELALPALLERLGKGLDPRGIPGILVAGDTGEPARAVVRDLDPLPLWDDALSSCADPADPDLWVPVQSRRGCPNDCSYCSTARIQGRQIRSRSPRFVVEAMARVARAGFRHFYFVDNSFNIPERQALELCRQLIDIRLDVTWRCILYPQHVREELVRAMADAGCVQVALGFESGCPRILKDMNKRYSPEEVRRISDMLATHGIRRFGFLLLGGPGETRESMEESLAFARSLNLDDLRVTTGIRIYPGTPLAKRAIEDGVITSNDDLLIPRFYLAPELEPLPETQ